MDKKNEVQVLKEKIDNTRLKMFKLKEVSAKAYKEFRTAMKEVNDLAIQLADIV